MDTKPNEKILSYIENSNMTSIQDLLEVVDAETIYALMVHFGGDSIFIPKIDKINAALRNESILTDYGNGLSEKALSMKYGLSLRYIRNILQGD